MKFKAVTILTILFSLALLAGCGGEEPKKKKKKKPKTEQTKAKPAEKQTAPDPTSGMSAENIAKAKELVSSTDEDAVEAVDGKKSYKKFCSVCHGFKGDMAINGAKDLTKTKTNLEERVAQIYFGKGLMTPFKGVMKDEEIISVAKYVATLRK